MSLATLMRIAQHAIKQNQHDEGFRCTVDGGQNPSMPQSTKERQEALRARRAMLGMTEVRGIYLPPELHAQLKAEAKRLLRSHKPEEKK